MQLSDVITELQGVLQGVQGVIAPTILVCTQGVEFSRTLGVQGVTIPVDLSRPRYGTHLEFIL